MSINCSATSLRRGLGKGGERYAPERHVAGKLAKEFQVTITRSAVSVSSLDGSRLLLNI